MGQQIEHRQSFFRRIATDATANTMAISAASLVPLMAMVGGGVDASRYYMTETRLQAACDAGALAARRAMDDGSFTSTERTIGENFFDQNYPDGTFGLEQLSRSYSANQEGEVNGTATGKLPTSIMGAFGYNEFDLSVACTADINISNTDIVFVLDVTGSMNRCPDGTSTSSSSATCSSSNNRIASLRSSALTFYDTVDAATSDSAQVRYGIVPYSQQVNVGGSLDAAWLATSHEYQSRVADWQTTITYGDWETDSTTYSRTSGASNWNQTSTYGGVPDAHGISAYVDNFDECAALATDQYDIYHSANSSNWTQVSQSGTNPRTTTYTGTVTYKYWDYQSGTYYGNGYCELSFRLWTYDATSDITETETREEIETQEFFWNYTTVTYDVSSVKSNGYLVAPTGWNEADETHTWAGCIEEADTVATGTWDPVPAGAYDLDIDLVPSSDAEKWKPMLPSLTYYRYVDGGSYNDSDDWTTGDIQSQENKNSRYAICPKAARKLAEFSSRSDLESWLSASNGFTATGNTYHDIGMIWGARFISPDGIFASENATAPNGDAISRHIVFMTDGTLQPINYSYNPYGVEWWDRRVTADGSTSLSDRHASRFQAACKAARNKNISVWVVAFGTALSQNLIDCATPGRAYHADDADELDDAFKEIAEQIAALRLTA